MATKINRSFLSKANVKILNRNRGKPPPWMVQMVRQKTKDLTRRTVPGANFIVGEKKVYLPDFTVAMIRTPHLPATHAQFRVPLNFTKLDLRDYLFHAYSVRVHSVRGFVTGPKAPPRTKNPDPGTLTKGFWERGERRPSTRFKRAVAFVKRRSSLEWDRQPIRKMMIVHLERPFVWPPVTKPEDMDEVSARLIRSLGYSMKNNNRVNKDNGRYLEGEKEAGQRLAQQAKALRQGKVEWRAATPPGLVRFEEGEPVVGAERLQTTGEQVPTVKTEVFQEGKDGKGKWVSEAEYDAQRLRDGPKGRRKRNERTRLPLR